MTGRRAGSALALLAFSIFTLASRPSQAEPATTECTAAAESAQLLRNAGKLVQARTQLLTCMKACPRLVQNDCGQWLHDVDVRVATVVVRATDARGADVSNVRVAVDGVTLMTRLDGLAAAVDPGVHRFVYEREGSPSVVEDVTIREGEKARTINVRIPDAPAPKKEAPPPPAPPPRPTVPLASFVLAGVGVLGMGTFALYHFSAKDDLDTLRNECAPRCPNDQVEAVDQKIFVSNVALGVGASALVAAVIVFIAEGGGGGKASSRGLGSPFVGRF